MRGCLVSMLILVFAYGPSGFVGNKGQKLLKAKGQIVKDSKDVIPNVKVDVDGKSDLMVVDIVKPVPKSGISNE